MLVKKYHSTISDIQNPIPGVYTLTFNSPKIFKFRPGQFLHLALDDFDPSRQWPESRCFSIQSVPGTNELKITYTVVGNFTQRMANELVVSQQIWLKLPYGDFFQRGLTKDNCVFIAGGTGITPFLSLITGSWFKDYSNPLLFLGFRNQNYHIYSNELQLAKSINPSVEIEILYENKQGRLNIEQIFKRCGETSYYISGPPLMINSFRQYLLDQGLGKANIVTDDWE